MPMNTKGSLVAGTLAAIGASACCVGPLVLLTLGIGGTWGARLTVLEPYSSIFTVLALVFLGIACRNLYFKPRVCQPTEICANERVIKRQRWLFWLITLPSLTVVAFPWFAPLFY